MQKTSNECKQVLIYGFMGLVFPGATIVSTISPVEGFGLFSFTYTSLDFDSILE